MPVDHRAVFAGTGDVLPDLSERSDCLVETQIIAGGTNLTSRYPPLFSHLIRYRYLSLPDTNSVALSVDGG